MIEPDTRKATLMPTPNGRLQLMLTGDVTSMRKRLTITDVTSGITFAEITLNPNEFLELMSNSTPGSVQGVPAWIASDLDRVGKHHAHVTARLRTVTSPVGDCATQVLETWATMTARRLGAYSHSISKHGGLRTSVIFRSYHDTPEKAAAWESEAQYLVDELRGAAPGGGPQ